MSASQLQQAEETISRARNAFKIGTTLPLSFRRKQLKNTLRMLDQSHDEILKALHVDIRKSKYEGHLEVEGVREEVKFFLRNQKSLAKNKKVAVNLLTLDDRSIVKREPFGVVLILGPWNYPIYLTLQPVVGAIAAGNCVIIKPSEISTTCSAVLAKIIPKYLDTECYPVIEAGLEETKVLLTNRFDYIFATGSTVMGKAVMSAAARHLTPVTLELGGKSPCYIHDDADIAITVKRIMWGKCMNLGQTCVGPDYILCSKKVEKKFLSLVTKVMTEWYGQKVQESPDLSRIINERNFHRLKSLLDRTKGIIAMGGETDLKDRWIEPTIITNVTTDDAVMEEEIFGPILPILTVDSPGAAIEFIVSRPKPLALYIFTKNDGVIKNFVEHTSSGGVCINDTIQQALADGLPFGGVGTSGMGRYHGKYSFNTFSHEKAILHRGFNKMIEKAMARVRYPPYSDEKLQQLQPIIRNMHKFSLK